jgi:hypothetical protein
MYSLEVRVNGMERGCWAGASQADGKLDTVLNGSLKWHPPPQGPDTTTQRDGPPDVLMQFLRAL